MQVSRPVKIIYKPGQEAFLNLSYRLIKPEPLLEAGFEVAKEQFLLSENPFNQLDIKPKEDLVVIENEQSIEITSKNLKLVFSKKSGFIESWEVNNKKIIEEGHSLRPNFWRPPNDNDYGAGIQLKLKSWKEATQKQELVAIKSETGNKKIIRIQTEFYLGNKVDASLFIDYKVNSKGELLVSQRLKTNKKVEQISRIEGKQGDLLYLMKYGMQMVLPKNYADIEFYGRGPWENYSDRNYASHVGIYKQKVKDQSFDYIRPQETGNKTDVRWYRLFTAEGYGIEIQSDTLLSMTARNFLDSDLDEGDQKSQKHMREIKTRPFTVLSLDYRQMGVGGIDSWWAWPLEKYRLPYGDYSFRYIIRPFGK
jgi:beta-galactosidase